MVRVLFVDDDPSILEIGSLYLSEFGDCEVDGLLSCDEAFAAVLDDPDKYDVIIADQSMPGMHGSNLLRALRLAKVTTRFILYSGYDCDPAAAADIRANGGFIVKKEGDPVAEYRTIAEWIHRGEEK